ncbi:MAG: DNA repair protein RecO [Ignavibacteriales bacterium]|nr:DNA repair protein RecO [Ignavibacteriales bacterium]
MAEIVKNEALILKKINFGNSSLIIHLYTKEHGKISAIIKGAKSPKSKLGSKVDILNHVEIVYYNKEEKELQLITQVNLIEHFANLKSDLAKLKYAMSICELILKLVLEKDKNEKLYRGVIRILNLINDEQSDPILHFTQFLIFFIKEIGFELNFNTCSNCGSKLLETEQNAFSYNDGIICEKCNSEKISTYQFTKELFNLFVCLTSKSKSLSYKKKDLENIIFILERYLIFHNSEFSGIKSLQIL